MIFTSEAQILAKVLKDVSNIFRRRGSTFECLISGDSGGPLYQWFKTPKGERAFVVGVVARGTGCANINKPGIFTRVTKFIPWIRKISKSGDC